MPQIMRMKTCNPRSPASASESRLDVLNPLTPLRRLFFMFYQNHLTRMTALHADGGDMATLTVRNIDEELKARLRGAAARHGHSMEEEVRQILRERLLEQDHKEIADIKSHGRFATMVVLEPGASAPEQKHPEADIQRRREEAAKWYEGYRQQVLANQGHEASLLSDEDVNALVHELR